jgi:hypothetical protein
MRRHVPDRVGCHCANSGNLIPIPVVLPEQEHVQAKEVTSTAKPHSLKENGDEQQAAQFNYGD